MKWKLPVLMLCASVAWSAPALAQSPESSQASDLNAVEALSVDEQDDGTYIRIHGTEEATFSVFKLDEPPRLFVDLSNSELADGELGEEVHNGVISQVGLVEFEDSFQDVARLVVGFDQSAHYDVRTDDDDVVVFVDGEDRDTSAPAVAEEERQLEERNQELRQARAELEQSEQHYQEQFEERHQDYEDAVEALEQRERQLEETQAELESLRQERDEASGQEREQLQASIDARNQELQEARQQVEEREDRVDEMQASIAELEEQRDEQRERFQQAQRRAEDAEQEVARLEGRLDEMDSEVDSAQARIEQQQRELQRAEERAQQLEAELDDARSDDGDDAEVQQVRDERQQQLDEVRAEARQARQQLEDAQAERQQWEEAREQHQQRLDDARAEVQEAQQHNEELTETLAEREEALEQREQEIAERDEEIERLKEIARTTDPDAPQMRAVPVDADEDNAVRGVRLETNEAGHSQIVVDLDRPGQFTTSQTGEAGRSVMVLRDVELPQELEQTLESDGDGGAVRFVSSYEQSDGDVHMEADLRSDASEVVRQDGNSVVWEFAPDAAGSGDEPMADSDDGRLVEDSNPERPTEGSSVTSQAPNYPRVVTNPAEVNTVPGMGTQPITIDLRNADIENVLRLVAEESGVNIIAGEDVSGEVTMTLQGVPLDEAFLTILQTEQLGFELRGNVIRVAPQETLNAEEEQRAEARARAQEVEPLEVFLLPINYASASDLTDQVDGLLSPRGSVSVDDRTNTLIIKDLADNLQSIRMLIETLDSQVPQVLIEARIVETNENFNREVGIQWGGDFSMSQGSGNPTGLIFPNVLGVSGGATDSEAPVEGTSENPNYAVNLPATAGTGSGGAMGLTMGSVGGAVNLNMRLSAMEDAGYAKIISAPRIMTLDNREATISQGTSIPISVVSAAGVQTIFVDATLELTVTPHVTPDGNVRMAIEATKNEPDFQNTGAQGDPTIIQNQAETELLVGDGDTTVIGGIYTENTGRSVSAVPFLHRIPILGFLFQNHSETENRSELLIFITPRIVNRAEALGIMSTGTLDSAVPRSE